MEIRQFGECSTVFGNASAVKTLFTSVKIEIREGESICGAISRLNRDLRLAVRREWHKTRPGCYTKPSDRRRRRESLRYRNAHRAQQRGRGGLTVFLTPRQLWNRLDPFESIAKPLGWGTKGGWKRRWREELARARRIEIEELRAGQE